MEFRSILFPVDFSTRCTAAATPVKAMAQCFDSSVCLFHVVQRFPEYAFEMPAIPETHWVEMRTRAARSLAEMARLRFDGVNATPVVRQGDAAMEIEAFAENRGIDLIMMPTHGTGRFRAALLGSVTAKVLSDARCPVWTSAHPEACETDAAGTPRSVLCAVDLGPESRALLRSAATFGLKTGAKVRLVHAVPGEECEMQRIMNREFAQYLKDAATIAIARLQQEAGTDFEVCLRDGKPSRVIADVARHHHADLVIVGRGKVRGFAGQLRTDAYSIIRDAPCPVLSI